VSEASLLQLVHGRSALEREREDSVTTSWVTGVLGPHGSVAQPSREDAQLKTSVAVSLLDCSAVRGL
jgi:hypothetical protein